MESKIFYITKYALTDGIVQQQAEISDDGIYAVFEDNDHWGSRFFRIGVDAHKNRFDAVVKSEDMRNKKIASLKRQIHKLEKLSFGGTKDE